MKKIVLLLLPIMLIGLLALVGCSSGDNCNMRFGFAPSPSPSPEPETRGFYNLGDLVLDPFAYIKVTNPGVIKGGADELFLASPNDETNSLWVYQKLMQNYNFGDTITPFSTLGTNFLKYSTFAPVPSKTAFFSSPIPKPLPSEPAESLVQYKENENDFAIINSSVKGYSSDDQLQTFMSCSPDGSKLYVFADTATQDPIHKKVYVYEKNTDGNWEECDTYRIINIYRISQANTSGNKVKILDMLADNEDNLYFTYFVETKGAYNTYTHGYDNHKTEYWVTGIKPGVVSEITEAAYDAVKIYDLFISSNDYVNFPEGIPDYALPRAFARLSWAPDNKIFLTTPLLEGEALLLDPSQEAPADIDYVERLNVPEKDNDGKDLYYISAAWNPTTNSVYLLALLDFENLTTDPLRFLGKIYSYTHK